MLKHKHREEAKMPRNVLSNKGKKTERSKLFGKLPFSQYNLPQGPLDSPRILEL